LGQYKLGEHLSDGKSNRVAFFRPQGSRKPTGELSDKAERPDDPPRSGHKL